MTSKRIALAAVIIDELRRQGGSIEYGINAWGSIPKLYASFHNPDGVTVIDVASLVQRLLDEGDLLG
jgi:hypothetical protein